MTAINVPDIEGPTAPLCFKQKLDPPHVMVRCDRRKGHHGLHSWEMAALIEQLQAAKTAGDLQNEEMPTNPRTRGRMGNWPVSPTPGKDAPK